MATLQEVQARIARLQAQADALIKRESSTTIAKIRDLMEKHGLTVADIETHAGGRQPGRKPGPTTIAKPKALTKYRDPKSGATWSGHGRAPAWIASARDRTKFLIDGNAAHPDRDAATAPKPGNYVRGPQTPKYRDPESGATWSGRGRAPAWLAGARDRSKLLIGSTEEERAASKSGRVAKPAGKKAATKAVAAKKITVRKVVTKRAGAATKPASTKKAAVSG